MNCKPHSLVYIVKLFSWGSHIGERGEVDLRGTVLRISTLVPGTAMWIIDGPPLPMAIFRYKPRPRVEMLQAFAIDDNYLRPFDDTDPAKDVTTEKEEKVW